MGLGLGYRDDCGLKIAAGQSAVDHAIDFFALNLFNVQII
jgi:hypothetical protein